MVNRRDRRYLVDPSLLFEENPAVAKAEVTVVVTEMGSAVAIRFQSGLGLVNRRASLGMIATGREVCHWFHTRAAFADRSCMLQQRCIGWKRSDRIGEGRPFQRPAGTLKLSISQLDGTR